MPPTPLSIDVFIGEESNFHVSSTLVSGEQDAVLVDAQLTLSNGRRLAEWIAATGKNLTAIVVTHKHPDHYYAANAVLERFPDAVLWATPEVAKSVAESQGAYAGWTGMFGDDVAQQPALPQPLSAGRLLLEGNEIQLIQLPQGDCEETTLVHIPSIRAVVAGDVLYNGTHMGLADTDVEHRKAWLAALDTLAGLDADTFVAGHAVPGKETAGAELIEANRRYLLDFDAALAASTDAAELIAKVEADYGHLALPLMLQFGAGSQFAS